MSDNFESESRRLMTDLSALIQTMHYDVCKSPFDEHVADALDLVATQLGRILEKEFKLHPLAAPPLAPEPCKVHRASSRICERGTKCCVVLHAASPSSAPAENDVGGSDAFHDWPAAPQAPDRLVDRPCGRCGQSGTVYDVGDGDMCAECINAQKQFVTTRAAPERKERHGERRMQDIPFTDEHEDPRCRCGHRHFGSECCLVCECDENKRTRKSGSDRRVGRTGRKNE